ncbi:TolC family outer membrane protein [Caulobacter endophyticus]|uniref:SPOR domain-containing protein n=1 Tax=Caulobacter endophyticus TaxID=2172652 RepID=A0A2T9JXE7_9CAUL|nr:TolC family outer membrane protein [Caulobacter endophyticus]PVM88349.1 hypothetical protein DDF67_13305 [Caulobacter endophyticus]
MIRHFFASVVTLALATSTADAQTLEDALLLAYRSNPDLVYQRAQVEGAEALVQSARAPGLPQAQINGAAGRSRIDLDSDSPDQTQDDTSLQLGVSQTLFAGGRIAQDIRRARAAEQATRYDLQQTEQVVLGQVITAYVDVQRDAAVLAARQQNVEALLKQSAGVSARFRQGEVTKTDLAQTEARLAQARSGVEAARANLAVSRAAFQRVVGQAPGELAPAPALPQMPPSADEAQRLAEQHSPSVHAAQLRLAASQAAVRRARAERSPHVSLDATVGQSDERLVAGAGGLADSVQRQDSYGLRLNLRVPLFQGGAVSAGVRQAKAAERGAMATEDGVLRQAQEGAANAWSRMVAADAIIESSRQQVNAARVAYRGGEYELNAGLRSTFDVLDLQQDVLSAQITLVTAERDAYVAKVNLLQAVGGLTLESLGVRLDGRSPAPIRPGALSAGDHLALAPAPRGASAVMPTGVRPAVPDPEAQVSRGNEAAASLPAARAMATAPGLTIIATPSPALQRASPSSASGSGAATLPTRAGRAAETAPTQIPASPAPSGPVLACAAQVGAYGARSVAEEARHRLQAVEPAPPAGWTIEPARTSLGQTFRVMAEGFADTQEAERFCRSLGAAGISCFVRTSRCASAAQSAPASPPGLNRLP